MEDTWHTVSNALGAKLIVVKIPENIVSFVFSFTIFHQHQNHRN